MPPHFPPSPGWSGVAPPQPSSVPRNSRRRCVVICCSRCCQSQRAVTVRHCDQTINYTMSTDHQLYQLYNVYRPSTVLCVYLLSTPNDSGRVVMRLDMVYAPSSINYNLYPPSYIPPSIQTNFVYNCKKSQFVTSKITVKSHKM